MRVQGRGSGRHEAADHGERGAILRREGLYSSHITEWRKAAEAGATSALGPKAKDRRDREIEALRARAETAETELVKTRAARWTWWEKRLFTIRGGVGV